MLTIKIPVWLEKLTKWAKKQIKKLVKFIKKKTLIPIIKWIVGFLSKKLDHEVEQSTAASEWKTKAIDDFKSWLADMQEPDFSADSASPDSCDLYTLLSEFSALRQEIKMQNREQHRLIRETGKLAESYQQSFEQTQELFKQKTKDIAELETKIRSSCEKTSAMPFLDLRSALVRGHEATLEITKSKGFFRRAPKGIESISQGYEMALRRFDKALGSIEIFCIKTVGQPFDPETMNAVDKKSVSKDQDGLVVEEHLSGFIRNGEILRTAEVVVGECEDREQTPEVGTSPNPQAK